MSISAEDLAVVAKQLGREPRGVLELSYRTPDGAPAVVKTAPRLPDGTPFPTLYYLTDPRLTGACSRLESAGVMRSMQARLAEDGAVAAAYRTAHESYLAERDAIESLGTQFTGGGMPDRVKCLHVLVAHALAKGPGVNPFGDEAVAMLADDERLRGSAVPEDWPALADLTPDSGIDLEQSGSNSTAPQPQREVGPEPDVAESDVTESDVTESVVAAADTAGSDTAEPTTPGAIR